MSEHGVTTMSWRRTLALWTLCAVAPVGGVSPAAAAPAPRDVEITWTAHGIPHIVGRSWLGLGYGYGYAAAKLDVCGLADAFATFSGTRSEAFGAEAQDVVRILGRRPLANAASDATRRLINGEAARGQPPSPQALSLARGFAAGFDRYIRDTPRTKLPAACRDSGVVRPITGTDVLNRALGAATLLSSGLMQREMFDAVPPGSGGEAPAPGAVRAASPTPAGSNAYAFGRSRTGGSGLLLGNPHFFWDGPDRFMEVHLTIPGRYDAMGVALLGVPVVMVGFNASLAWTHTVSTDVRGAVYELKLDPADPTRYLVDGRSEAMNRRTVSFGARRADGRPTTIDHVFWMTRFGPVVMGPATPWDRTHAYALADANGRNARLLDQWIDIGQSRTVGALKASLDRVEGLPWVNTIAADSAGGALYADVSVTPDLSAATVTACRAPGSFPLANYLMLLDGSKSACARAGASEAPMAPAAKPFLLTDDYVENSNASHWLVNPRRPLEGFSPAIGSERTVPNFRTRQGHVQVAGAGRMTAAALEALLLGDASLQADLVLPGVLEACRRTAVATLADGARIDLAEACRTLTAWDRRYDLDSRGAQLFSMLVARLRPPGAEDLAADASLWLVPFDYRDPLGTPRDIDPANARIPIALGEAVRALDKAGIPLSARLGDVQFVERGGARIPLHGGATFSALLATLVPGVGFTEPMNPSNSYIQVVTFNAKGPVADAVLASSQTPDPASLFYADQTWLYSRKEWVRLPYNRRDVAAAAIEPTVVLHVGGGGK